MGVQAGIAIDGRFRSRAVSAGSGEVCEACNTELKVPAKDEDFVSSLTPPSAGSFIRRNDSNSALASAPTKQIHQPEARSEEPATTVMYFIVFEFGGHLLLDM